MIGGVSVFLNQLLLTSDLHFHTCAVKSSSDQVKVSCIMSVDGFKLRSGYWLDLPSVSYNLWYFWLMSSFIINLSKSIVQTHFFFCTQIIWELLLPWNTLNLLCSAPQVWSESRAATLPTWKRESPSWESDCKVC